MHWNTDLIRNGDDLVMIALLRAKGEGVVASHVTSPVESLLNAEGVVAAAVAVVPPLKIDVSPTQR